MSAPFRQVFIPSSFQELFSTWNRSPDAALYAGGTEHIRNLPGRIPLLPDNIISLHKLEELHKINRTERYIEIGAMVKLNQIIQLGKIVPEALTRCLECIAGYQLRNLITIGGNICHSSRRLDSSGPMIALDAQYELRTAQSARWIPAARFSSLPGPPALAPQEILTRIRIPLEPWNFTSYRKLRSASSHEPGAGILITMRNQKNILSQIRVVYSGKAVLRDKNSETMLAGKRLPLERKDAEAFVDSWKTYLSALEGVKAYIFLGSGGSLPPELAMAQILNFIETTIMRISD